MQQSERGEVVDALVRRRLVAGFQVDDEERVLLYVCHHHKLGALVEEHLEARRRARRVPNAELLSCDRGLLTEHGPRALYVNFQYRVAIIALWTAILNATDPFAVREAP